MAKPRNHQRRGQGGWSPVAQAAAPAPARTPRGRATEAALLQAARRVFERDGFLDARITDITAMANAATGSFYRYFPSKEAIFTAVIDQLNDQGLHLPSMEDLEQPPDELVGSVATHLREYLETFARNAKLMSVMEQVTNVSDAFRRHRTEHAQVYVESNAEVVRRLQEAGRADAKLDPMMTARTLSTTVSRAAYINYVLEDNGDEDLDVLVETLTRIWVNALNMDVPESAFDALR
jgi:AcrR family transcriptional regulator